jgi:histidine ammonia-lyase
MPPTTQAAVLTVGSPADLGPDAVLAVAQGARLRLSPDLVEALAASHAATVEALAGAGPVYGVSTGMGRLAGMAVAAEEQPGYQDDLMLARAVGTAPWLDRRAVRAATATRLRTLLEPEAGTSPALAQALVAVLDADLHPAVPATAHGAAGEILALAHLGGFLTGSGQGLDEHGVLVDSPPLLRDAGLAPYHFAAKEGVAFLQGVPVATALAVLAGADARLLAAQQLGVAAGEVALVHAPRGPYDPALSRGDAELTRVHGALLDLAGDGPAPRMLQAPVSFRVLGPALARLLRCVRHLDEAVGRALAAVSTSPALVDGRFVGTTGFDGFDLAASADDLRVAVLHAAEVAAARLHRLLDPRVSGLPAQLSATPGREAGLVALHKRAVGVVHEARRGSAPASLGATETSLGQEDVQSFGLEALAAAGSALAVLRDVTACELVALHQGSLLSPTGRPIGSPHLDLVLHNAFEHLGADTSDRPTGREVTVIRDLLAVGWGHDVLGRALDARTSSPPTTP